MRRTTVSWSISILAGVLVGGVGGFLALQAFAGPRGGSPQTVADSGGAPARQTMPASGTSTTGMDRPAPGKAGATDTLRVREAAGQAARGGVADVRQTAIVTATAKVRDSVVTVYVVERTQSTNIFDFFGGSGSREQAGLGSGVIVSVDGYILTNDHVVGRADKITVQLADGREFEGVVVDTDPNHDLAVLKIDPQGQLPVAELGDSSDILVGEWVIALGSPFGFYVNANDPRPSVSVGVVSAVGRSFVTQSAGKLRYFPGTIQTDAAINPGNSGGPLVNALGQVIGINSFIISQSGESVGIGFSIPINQAKQALDQIRAHGYIRRSWTGLVTVSNDRYYVARYQVRQVAGALIVNPAPPAGSPAEKAGLNPGCVIVHAGERDIRSSQELEEVLVQAEIGDTIQIVYYGFPDLERHTTSLTIEEEPRNHR